VAANLQTDKSASQGGFPNSAAGTVIPNAFFSQVLPEITDPAELVVTSYVFFAFASSGHRPRYVTMAELEADAGLARSLANLCEGGSIESLRRGLKLAVQRQSLIQARTGEEGNNLLFAPNMPANRRVLEQLAGEGVTLDEALPPATGESPVNIYTLYEANIGGITPLIAEELRDAEQNYPPEWIHHAFREAAELNKRSWRYIRRILQRWEQEGPNYATDGRDPEADWLARRYSAGKRGTPRR
jgi:DnaD/phage-associated family protein